MFSKKNENHSWCDYFSYYPKKQKWTFFMKFMISFLWFLVRHPNGKYLKTISTTNISRQARHKKLFFNFSSSFLFNVKNSFVTFSWIIQSLTTFIIHSFTPISPLKIHILIHSPSYFSRKKKNLSHNFNKKQPFWVFKIFIPKSSHHSKIFHKSRFFIKRIFKFDLSWDKFLIIFLSFLFHLKNLRCVWLTTNNNTLICTNQNKK